MDLNKYTNEELVGRLRELVGKEKDLDREMLEHLEEVERRRFYLDLGYSSLFTFCTDGLGFSSGAAYRRIASMRLIKSLPPAQREGVKEKLTQGSLTIHHLTQAQSIFRSEPERFNSAEEKQKVLEKISSTSVRESEKILAEIAPRAVQRLEYVKALSTELTQVTVTLDHEALYMLERFKNLTAHHNPQGKTGVALKLALKTALSRLDPTLRNSSKKELVSTSEVVSQGRYVPAEIRRRVWNRDGGKCVYKSPDGKVCGSAFMLQMDHIQPLAMGGKTELDNLRLLCASHNLHLGKKVATLETRVGR